MHYESPYAPNTLGLAALSVILINITTAGSASPASYVSRQYIEVNVLCMSTSAMTVWFVHWWFVNITLSIKYDTVTPHGHCALAV